MKYCANVVWMGTILGDKSVEDFEKFFLKEFGYHVKYVEEFEIIDGFYKGINCLLFRVCCEELSKFSIFRIKTNDMKWLEDLYDNEKDNIPLNIIEKYKLNKDDCDECSEIEEDYI